MPKTTIEPSKRANFGSFEAFGGFCLQKATKNHRKMPILVIFGWFSFKKFSQKPPSASFNPFFAYFTLPLVVFVSKSNSKTTIRADLDMYVKKCTKTENLGLTCVYTIVYHIAWLNNCIQNTDARSMGSKAPETLATEPSASIGFCERKAAKPALYAIKKHRNCEHKHTFSHLGGFN